MIIQGVNVLVFAPILMVAIAFVIAEIIIVGVVIYEQATARYFGARRI